MGKMTSNTKKTNSNEENFNYIFKKISHIIDKQNISFDAICLNKICVKLLRSLKQSMDASGGCIYFKFKNWFKIGNL